MIPIDAQCPASTLSVEKYIEAIINQNSPNAINTIDEEVNELCVTITRIHAFTVKTKNLGSKKINRVWN